MPNETANQLLDLLLVAALLEQGLAPEAAAATVKQLQAARGLPSK